MLNSGIVYQIFSGRGTSSEKHCPFIDILAENLDKIVDYLLVSVDKSRFPGISWGFLEDKTQPDMKEQGGQDTCGPEDVSQ